MLSRTITSSARALSRDALSVASEFHPELAIVDIRMPDLDGFELMAQLKARFPRLDVILMTGSVDDLDEKLVRAIRSPAFYFIQKPFDREVLRTLVERCVELRWRREEHRRHLKRLETEMAEARAFQQSLLPDRETVVNRVAVCCRYTPCSALGGDLYDYAAADPGQTALLIADVSGHGVSAAMLTGIVKSAFHASHVDGFEPIAVVQRVSRDCGLQPGSIRHAGRRSDLSGRRPVAVCECRPSADRSVGTARANRCGSQSTGPLVSPVLTASTWEAPVVPIDEGDHLLLYTDGISEVLADSEVARKSDSRPDRPRFRRRSPAARRDSRRRPSRAGGRPQPDDLTLLTARVLGP